MFKQEKAVAHWCLNKGRKGAGHRYLNKGKVLLTGIKQGKDVADRWYLNK